MPFTTPEAIQALREKARQLLREGTLPPAPRSVFAGVQANSKPCRVCGLPIQPGQIGYEADVVVGDHKQTFHLHPNCQAAWETESPRDERRA